MTKSDFKKIPQKNLRLGQVELEELDRRKKEMHGTYNEVIRDLLNKIKDYEKNSKNPERDNKLVQFMQHSSMLVDLYKCLIDENITMRDSVRFEFKKELNSKDEIINGLQKEKEALIEKLTDLKTKNIELSQKCDLQSQIVQSQKETISYQEHVMNNLNEKINDLKHIIDEIKQNENS